MPELVFPTTAAALGAFLDAEIQGDVSVVIHSLAPIDAAHPGALSFCADAKYYSAAASYVGVTVLVARGSDFSLDGATKIFVDDPKSRFAEIADSFRPKFPWVGISPTVYVGKNTHFQENVGVGPNSVICDGVRIGSRTKIHALVYIGEDVSIGSDVEIFPNVTILAGTKIGDRVRIFPGTVLGAEGFGVVRSNSGHALKQMPQIGNVEIADDVRIGANCTIDRATLQTTSVGKNSFLDAHVHVGHNTRVGARNILCAQVGLGGSCETDDEVVMGGQVGVGHGVHIGKGAEIAAQSGTSTNLSGGERYLSSPAIPIREALKSYRYFKKLPEIWKKLTEIEKIVMGETKENG